MAMSNEATAIRRAREEDIGKILDLLTYYELPRSYFEPFYLKDTTYRPEHSWVAEQDGRLQAHLRVFDREVRVSAASLRVAAVGNVITAPDQRGRGHAGGSWTPCWPRSRRRDSPTRCSGRTGPSCTSAMVGCP